MRALCHSLAPGQRRPLQGGLPYKEDRLGTDKRSHGHNRSGYSREIYNSGEQVGGPQGLIDYS